MQKTLPPGQWDTKETMPRKCSAMSSYMNAPWRCGDGLCMGREEDCGAKALNEEEKRWVAKAEAERSAHLGRFDPFVLATLHILGIPEPEISIEAARKALGSPSWRLS